MDIQTDETKCKEMGAILAVYRKCAWNEKEGEDGMVKLWSGEAGNRNKRKGEEGS